MCFSLVVLYGALATGEGSAYERGYPSASLLLPIAMCTAICSFYGGVKFHVKFYAPYYLAVSSREYSDVKPTARTAEFADAGIIHFNQDATVDTSRSFGYKTDEFTYCVAPIVSRNAEVHPLSGGPKITFWAVGKDCCGRSHDFECDGAGEIEVRNAFVERDFDNTWITKFLVPRAARPKFIHAVEAAKATHNLRSDDPDTIMLVRWAAAPEETLTVWYNRAVTAIVVICVLYTVAITVVWSLIHWWFDSDIRKLTGNSNSKSAGKSSGSRVKDPFMLGGNHV